MIYPSSLYFDQSPQKVREEKAHQREDTLKDQIRHLMLRLKVL